MFYHLRDFHGRTDASEEVTSIFSMKRLSTDRDPLRRIVREAVKIRRAQVRETDTKFSFMSEGELKIVDVETVLMNSKDEFHLPKLVSINIQQD